MIDSVTAERIKTLHPKIRKKVLDMYNHINNKLLGKGVRLRFSRTYSTPEEQTAIYAQGRTKPGIIVTDAKAWGSVHQYGLAWDIVILYDNDGNGTFEEASWSTVKDGDKDKIADWKEVTDYFISQGCKNGFTKNGKKWDFPHFQLDFGLTVKEMKAKIDSGDFIYDTVGGKTIKYINI